MTQLSNPYQSLLVLNIIFVIKSNKLQLYYKVYPKSEIIIIMMLQLQHQTIFPSIELEEHTTIK